VLFLTFELLKLGTLNRASAQQAPFYQDKSVRIVVGFTPGASTTAGRGSCRATCQVYSRNPNFVVPKTARAPAPLSPPIMFIIEQNAMA